MKVAIIGAGFCGLAVAWQILQHLPHFSITLFDSKEIGKGTSGMAAGLMHPYAGAHAKLNLRGIEGVKATRELLDLASSSLNQKVFSANRGILRVAMTEEQKSDYFSCAQKHSDTQWFDDSACQSLAPGCAHGPGLWIPDAYVVYSSLYLQGLWQACQLRGVLFEKKTIHSLKELHDFDITIVTAGAESRSIHELKSLPLNSVKGQVLEFAWPNDWTPLSCALNSYVYILMTEGNQSCLVGATYERNFKDTKVDIEKAKEEILPKAYTLFPLLQESTIVNCYAGLRAVTPTHLPLIEKISPSQWVLSGMGSKGLLYHALYAKELVQSIRKSIH